MRVIQVRGTSGSGKSTVMRRVMDGSGPWVGVTKAGRKNPWYYVAGDPLVAVVGHYASQCGGGDTIGSAPAIYGLTKVLEQNGVRTVLQEGLLLSEDSRWTNQLKLDGHDVRCLFLTTPLDRCLRQIEGRRAEAGNEKPLNPANTANRVRVIDRARLKLLEYGVPCRRASADQAPGIVLDWLRRS